jgi:hypothetical protein
MSGRSRDWLKLKNPSHPAVQREFEEDWGDAAAVTRPSGVASPIKNRRNMGDVFH